MKFEFFESQKINMQNCQFICACFVLTFCVCFRVRFVCFRVFSCLFACVEDVQDVDDHPIHLGYADCGL